MASSYPNFNHKEPDKILSNRVRLAILAALNLSDEVDFVSLKNAIHTTDGNLSIQLMNLEDAGYITSRREIFKNRYQTNIAITNEGRRALLQYRDLINRWIKE